MDLGAMLGLTGEMICWVNGEASWGLAAYVVCGRSRSMYSVQVLVSSRNSSKSDWIPGRDRYFSVDGIMDHGSWTRVGDRVIVHEPTVPPRCSILRPNRAMTGIRRSYEYAERGKAQANYGRLNVTGRLVKAWREKKRDLQAVGDEVRCRYVGTSNS